MHRLCARNNFNLLRSRQIQCRAYHKVAPSSLSSNIYHDYNIKNKLPNLSKFRVDLPSVSLANEVIYAKGQEYLARPLYLDVQATTSVDPRVVDIMNHYNIQSYGNPHSRTHFYGFEAEKAVENAREQVKLIF